MSMVLDPPAEVETRAATAARIATELFEQKPSWITYFREVLGVDGLVRRLFPTAAHLADFELTPQYEEIQRLLGVLRQNHQEDAAEAQSVITVRLPKSVHKALKEEADLLHTSMNRLVIGRILKVTETQPGEE